MAAGAWKVYDSAKEYSGTSTLDLGSASSWRLSMFLSTSNCTVLSKQTYGQLTNEVATGSGYTQGGVALEGISWSGSGGTVTFGATDLSPAITASGGTITGRHLVIWRNVTVNSVSSILFATCVMDSTPADVNIQDGFGLNVTFPTNRIATLDGATSD